MTAVTQNTERVFLGLGSNLGDRLRYLQRALAALEREGVRVVQASSVYESEAHTMVAETQPDFLNAVVEVASVPEPLALLQSVLRIEADAGRSRLQEQRWGPRTLDIDILLFGGRVIQAPELQVPHPRLAERRFVLEPLAEIASEVFVPAPFSMTVSALLGRCTDAGAIRRVAPPSTLHQFHS